MIILTKYFEKFYGLKKITNINEEQLKVFISDRKKFLLMIDKGIYS